MNSSTLRRSICMALALGLPAVAVAQEPMKPSTVAEAVMPNDTKSFFEAAASSNLFEIESSQLALKTATDPELKAFAQKMVTDHTAASKKLKALAAKKDVTLPTTLLKRHELMLDVLKGEKAGKEFDAEYADKMVTSHKEAVSLFDQTAKKATDPQVKAFAAELLPKLQAHGGEAIALESKHSGH